MRWDGGLYFTMVPCWCSLFFWLSVTNVVKQYSSKIDKKDIGRHHLSVTFWLRIWHNQQPVLLSHFMVTYYVRHSEMNPIVTEVFQTHKRPQVTLLCWKLTLFLLLALLLESGVMDRIIVTPSVPCDLNGIKLDSGGCNQKSELYD